MNLIATVLPVVAVIVTYRNGVELGGIGLGLVQNVSKLMVHGLEVVLIHHVEVVDLHRVDLEQRNLDTTLGKTDGLGTCSRVIGGRTHQKDDAGTILLEEVLTGNLVIYIEPQVLAEHSQVDGVLVGGGHQVIVHIGADTSSYTFQDSSP